MAELTKLDLFELAIKSTTDECIFAPLTPGGNRPSYTLDGQTMPMARAVFIKAFGPLEPGIWVLHNCNQGHRGCINLRHLRPGTAMENSLDYEKSQSKFSWNGSGKLREADVLEIRKRFNDFCLTLGIEFGVEAETIKSVANRKSWKSL